MYKWKAKYPEEYERVIHQPESKSPKEGGSATQTCAPPQFWSDLEISKFKEGVIVHGWRGWAAIAKNYVITRSQKQVGDFAYKWKAKYP